MTIDRFRDVLGAVGPPPDARELSEMLWLARHLSPPPQAPPDAPADEPPPDAAEPEEPSGSQAPPDPAAGPRAAPPPVPLAAPPPPRASGDFAGDAAGVLVPTAPMLADPLGVQRALRPLKRRVPSPHRFEVDEDATAARIADTRVWTPVLVPSPERWLSLTLVVDTGPTMRLWRPLARELEETLLRQGAFRDVNVCHLDATGRVTHATGAPSQDPGTLLDTSGRRAVLVLSDCSGPHWWDGRAAQAVRRWAQNGPTAILQPLAERLWRRTAAPATPGTAVLPRPGAPNTDLRFTPYDGAPAPGVPVPVLEVAPRWFGAWARLLAGSDPQPAAIATLPSRPAGTPPPARERELPVAERVRRFLATASPGAAELAAHVAVSVPSLPVMRLIQHRILGRSGPGQLAEVLLSGLLRPAGGVRYAFVPGAREALLDTLPRPEAQHTRRVLDAVSAEIERRAGTAAETFRALLPAGGGPLALTADTDHFALVTPETRSALVPVPSAVPASSSAPDFPDLLDLQDADVEELIGPEWNRPLQAVPIGMDGDHSVTLDVLPRSEYGGHGLITGPRGRRDALLRTLVFSLALRHSPDVVNFAFADFSGGMAFVGLGPLPHVAIGLHPTSADSPLIDELPDLLETERRRREAVIRIAGAAHWHDYQAAVAAGRPLEPLPALAVVVDNAGPLLRARPDLVAALTFLCEKAPAQGIAFVWCSPDDARLPPEINAFLSWQMGMPDPARPARAFLHVPGEFALPSFRPALISLDVADPVIERMRRRPQRARRLARPPEPEPSTGIFPQIRFPDEAPAARPAEEDPFATPSTLSESDVLTLNGAGMLRGFGGWDLPRGLRRTPAIGHDAEGDRVTPFPPDARSGFPHGLIVGETAARQHIVRNIALALAATHSPRTLTFAFAGLGEHPLGKPIDLPHVVYSDEELLGRPSQRDRFTDLLSAELEARESPGHGRPDLAVFVDASLTLPSGLGELTATMLRAAQSGAPRGIRLFVAASTVEDTTIWDRFLPLLTWRVTASRLPPAVLRRVHGQGGLPFPRDRTAYLTADEGPLRFTPAPDAPPLTLDLFVRRTNERHTDIVLPGLLGTDTRAEDPSVWSLLPMLYNSERKAAAQGMSPRRHLVVSSMEPPLITRTATLYGRLLVGLKLVAHGDVHESTVDWRGRVVGEPGMTMDDLFQAGRGGVLLLKLSVAPEGGDVTEPSFPERLLSLVQEYGEDPIVVLAVDPDQQLALLRTDPFFTDKFRWFEGLAAFPGPQVRPGSVSDGTLRLGFEAETAAPVLLDLGADRHLLISGPPGRSKRNLLGWFLDAVTGDRDQRKSRVYILDERGRLGLSDRETVSPNVRYADDPDEFGSLVEEALAYAGARGRNGDGPTVYVFAVSRPRPHPGDPLTQLLPALGTGDHYALHLFLTHDPDGLEVEPLDPLVTALREIKAPAVLTGYSGPNAELWNVPQSLLVSLPVGQAVLARNDRYRTVWPYGLSPGRP